MSDKGQYGAIYVRLYEDLNFLRLSFPARDLLRYLLTCPGRNIANIFILNREQVTRHIGLKSRQIDRYLEELLSIPTDLPNPPYHPWIAYEIPIIWVINGLKHEPGISLDNPKHKEAVQKIIDSLPKREILYKFLTYYGYEIPNNIGIGIAYKDGYGNQSTIKEPVPVKEQVKEPSLAHPDGARESILTPFDQFWEAYPKKKSQGDAEKAWGKIKPGPDLLKTILESISQAKETEDWQKDGGKFIPYPATWLNAKGWKDDYSTLAKAPISDVARHNLAMVKRMEEKYGTKGQGKPE